MEDGIGAIERPDGVEKINDFGKVQELQLTGKRDAQQIVAEIMSHTRVTSFELTRPSLHDIFVRIAGPVPQEVQHA